MSWKKTQTSADEGIEVALMFTHEWDEAHHLGPDEGPSRKMGDSLPELTLDSSEMSS